ncbi:MAG: hypothetical protein VKJ04_09425 [Vampirovibrionales bacterium]|nr:hypothetical protein [Vampirovibrionales bacterium]
MLAIVNIDPTKATQWAKSDSLSKREAVLYIWHAFCQLLGLKMSFSFGMGRILRMLTVFAIPALPVWIAYYYSRAIDSEQAFFQAFVIGLLLVYQWAYDRWIPSSQNAANVIKLENMLAASHSQILTDLAEHSRTLSSIDEINLISKVLRCIEIKTRLILREYNALYFQVSLLLFDDEQCKTIKVVARADQSRETGKVVNSEQTIAYYVAKVGAARSVCDLRNHPIFPNKGLSDLKAPYRSILFIPLTINRSGKTVCPGVLTIDSDRTFDFWSKRNHLTTQIMPLVGVVKFLLKKHPNTLEIGVTNEASQARAV